MPRTYHVSLSRHRPARFPDKCVACGRESPGSTVRLVAHMNSWWMWLLPGHIFSLTSVKAPACNICSWRLHVLRLTSLLILVVTAMVVIVYLSPLVEPLVPRPLRKWAMAGMCVIVLVPYMIYQWLRPHPFDITAHVDRIEYEFSDLETAAAISAENHHAPVEIIDRAFFNRHRAMPWE